MRAIKYLSSALLVSLLSLVVHAQTMQTVVDIPTRSGVTQRMLVLRPPDPKAAMILLPGSHGGLQMFPNGSLKWGDGNFLVRSRQLFADQGLVVAVVDAPSDRQSWPYLAGFRQTPEHVADLKEVVAWLRETVKVPVWLVGTSRGTQSAAYVATELAGPDAPDGIVLTSTILVEANGRPVPAMPLGKIQVPVLVVHHEQDGCAYCAFSEMHALMTKLTSSPRIQLLPFKGGENKGNPCEAFAHHGFNGIESEVVQKIAAWVLEK